MAKRFLVALAAPMAVGCHSSDTGLPTDPPKKIEMVATGGFSSPTDAVASPDGRELYFAALDDMKQAALFKTSSAPGSTAEVLAAGDPLQHPTGLVMSCDGKTLFVADMAGDDGAVLSQSVDGGTPGDLGATGIVRPSGLAMGPDCKTLYLTARTEDGKPALATMPITGGATTLIWAGDPLVSPTGLHVDDQGVAWVMDHRAVGDAGEGVLFAIPSDGSAANVVISDLRMGTPGGVSLVAGGGTAVMPTLDHDGHAQLTSVNIASGEVSQLPAPDMIDPAGLRTARSAGVFAVVDSEGGAIFRAE